MMMSTIPTLWHYVRAASRRQRECRRGAEHDPLGASELRFRTYYV